jgi:hypothetical protein
VQKHHSWDLRLIVYAIVALSAVIDICGFQRFAPALGLPAWAGALCVIPIKLVEWNFLSFATRLCQSGWLGTIVCPAPAVAWCLAAFLSMLAADSTIYDVLATADRTSAKAAETRENVTAALGGVKAQLALVSTPLPRPSKLVEQELGWEPLLPEAVRRATRDCTRLVSNAMPEGCKKRVELRKELAAATEYERLSLRAEKLRVELHGLGTEVGQISMARSFDISLGRFLRIDGKDGIALMGMLILSLTSAFGPFGLYLVGGAGTGTSPMAASPPFDGGTAQANGQGGQAAESRDMPPKSAQSAHVGSAHDSAQPTLQPTHSRLEEEAESAQGQPAQGPAQPAQSHGVRPPEEPACSLDESARECAHESAHGSAQESFAGGTEPAQTQPAQDCPDARPPFGKPAPSRIRSRPGQAKRATRRAAEHVPSDNVVHLAVPDARREALQAVRSFVAMLDRAPTARATGSALANAYESLRAVRGWPVIARNVLGTLLRIAVQEVGGRKLKSGVQVYVGVCIPTEWGMQAAA